MNVASVCVKAAAGYQIYLRAYYYGVYRAYRERKEGLHGQRAVSGGIGYDEGKGNGVHLIEIQRVVEGLEEGNFAERGAYIRAISGSCGEDASGRYKVGFAYSRGYSSEVGTNIDIQRGYQQLLLV